MKTAHENWLHEHEKELEEHNIVIWRDDDDTETKMNI